MRRLLKFYFRFWYNLWLREKTSIEKSNIVNCKSIPDRLLSTLRRLPEKSSIKSQVSDKLQSIAKLTCLSDKSYLAFSRIVLIQN